MIPIEYDSGNWFSIPRTLVGVMSGTSLDAIDVAVVKFNRKSLDSFTFDLISYSEYEIGSRVKEAILSIIDNPVRIGEISSLHYFLSQLYSDAINQSLANCGLTPDLIHAVGIHGQTVWHQPNGIEYIGYDIQSTLQLGSGPAVASLTEIPTINDFRAADIALGGQGAPLVPIFDYYFIRSEDSPRIVLNIGGIANITYLPANCIRSGVTAFDTGPGNMLIDSACKKFLKLQFDRDGKAALSGELSPGLFEELQKHTFIREKPPKSTGRETFGSAYFNEILTRFESIDAVDIIHTLTYFTAWSIAENIRQFASERSSIIVSGGGSKNKAIMNFLKKELPESTISTSETYGLPGEAKEAVAFAFLAYLRMGGLPGNLPSVTGAKREAVLGTLSLP